MRTCSDALIYSYLSTPLCFVPWFASTIAHYIPTARHFCSSDLETFIWNISFAYLSILA